MKLSRIGYAALGGLFASCALFGAGNMHSVGAQQQQGAQQRGRAQGTLVFAVVDASGAEASIDPVVVVNDGRYAEPVTGEDSEAAMRSFAEERFRVGQSYRMIFGGGAAGVVRVRRAQISDECFRSGARVELQTTARLGGNVMALATDSEELDRTNSSRRAPTDAERAAVTELARAAFRQQRVVNAALLSGMQTINLTATDLNGDGNAELIGTFMLRQGNTARHLLFLIAEPQGGNYRTGLARYNLVRARDMMDPSALQHVGNQGFFAEILIDQLDLNGDRTGEVFTFNASAEGAHYAIYSKQSGRWQRVYEMSAYRCAY